MMDISAKSVMCEYQTSALPFRLTNDFTKLLLKKPDSVSEEISLWEPNVEFSLNTRHS